MALCLFPTDDVAPYFKTEPVRTQVHLEGNRLVLTCMAEGSWPLEFKWLHNNRELTKFSLEYRQGSPPLRFLLTARVTTMPRKGTREWVWCNSLREGVPVPVLGDWGSRSGAKDSPAPGMRRPCPAEPNRGPLGGGPRRCLDRAALETVRGAEVVMGEGRSPSAARLLLPWL